MNNMKMYKVRCKSYILRTFNASLILPISFFFLFQAIAKGIFLSFLQCLQVACKDDFKIKMYVAKYLRIF